jgi:DNA-binding winged helix-turn-helix (wHTH) protein/Tol biopolymer transport system component
MQILLNNIFVDTDTNTIGQGSNTLEIESQSMAVLTFLIKHAGRLVTKEMLLNEVWETKVVTVNSLHRVIAILRKSFDDDSSQASFIKTVHGKGYMLIAKVSTPPNTIRLIRFAVLFALCIGLLVVGIYSWMKPISIISYRDLGNETSLLGMEYQPQLASDNTALMFVHRAKFNQSESVLMLKMLESDELTILHNFKGRVNALAWSDDKQQIAMAIQFGERCHVYRFTLNSNNQLTENAEPLFLCVSHSPMELAWSIDGKSLFVLNTPSSQHQMTTLSRFNTTVSEASVKITTLPEISGFDRAPDSDTLILYSNITAEKSQVWHFSPQEKTSKVVDFPRAISQINWLSSKEEWLVLADDRLYLLDLQGNIEEVKDSYRLGIIDISVADNGKIFYNTSLSKYDLQELNLHLKNEVKSFQPSSNNQAAASYSPDGKYSVFLSEQTNRGWELSFFDGKKSSVIPIAGYPLQLATPQWHPDGERVMLLTNDYQLLSVDIDTSAITILTAKQDLVLAGIWAKDEHIYYSKPINERFEIFYRNLDTGHEEQLTNDGGYFSQLSHNREILYFNKRNQPGLWQLQLSTAQVQLVFEDFGADNYSRWQLVDETIYFRHHSKQGFGIFKSDLKGKVQQIVKSSNIWLFSIAKDQSKALISNQERAYGDIKSGYLTF